MTIIQRPIVKNPAPVAGHLVSVPIVLLQDILQEESIGIYGPEYVKESNCWPHDGGRGATAYNPDLSSRANIKCTVKWIGKSQDEAMAALCEIDGVDHASAFIQWGGYRDSGRWYEWRPSSAPDRGYEYRGTFTPFSEVVWAMDVGGAMLVGRTA